MQSTVLQDQTLTAFESQVMLTSSFDPSKEGHYYFREEIFQHEVKYQQIQQYLEEKQLLLMTTDPPNISIMTPTQKPEHTV